jgi:DNA invertase Pin-like site-specific DNA recombinase
MSKFICYYRVSTDKQGQSGLGLEAQKTICYAYARSINAEILAEFTDIESGSHNDRAELLKALALLELENDSRLLVAKQCRLTRSVALMSSLLEKKVRLTIAETPNASIFELHIRAVLNEETRRQISINTRNALMAAKARGIKLGAPREALMQASIRGGYASADIKIEFAMSIKPMVDLAIANCGKPSCRNIATKLNELGVKTFLGHTWTAPNVSYYLTNYKKRVSEYNAR